MTDEESGGGFFTVGALLVALVVAVGGAGYVLMPTYNELVSLDEDVQKEWANIDALLQQRYALIPSLTAAVRGATDQEDDIFLNVANAHAGYQTATTRSEKIEASYRAERQLGRLSGFFARYPNLKSNQNIDRLMTELSSVEGRIASQRMAYNESVKKLNTLQRSLGGSLVARVAGFEVAAYYQPPTGARVNPGINLGGNASSHQAMDDKLKQRPEVAAEAGGTAPPSEGEQKNDYLKRVAFRGSVGSGEDVKVILELPEGGSVTVARGQPIPGTDAMVLGADETGVVVQTKGGATFRLSK